MKTYYLLLQKLRTTTHPGVLFLLGMARLKTGKKWLWT